MSIKNKNQETILENSSVLNRRDFLKYSSVTLGAISLGGCSSRNIDYSKITEYPIEDNVYTTLEKTVKLSEKFSSIIQPRNLKNIREYDEKGYGVWVDGGPLLAEVRNDIMPDDYKLPRKNKTTKLLKFFAITDIHIIDKESPSQLLYLQPSNYIGDKFGKDFESKVTSIYSPKMLYSTHILDAMVQTINALHEKDNIDFGISLGDVSNSTQYNETRWYIDVLDGQIIEPSSGNNIGANSIDYQKPYKAVGLNKNIPWYQVIGNHDHFWLGSIPLDDKRNKINLRASYVDDKVIAMPDLLFYSDNVFKRDDTELFYMGVIDGSDPYGDIIKAGLVKNFKSAPTVVPDVKRRSLTKVEWTKEFFKTTSEPKGHGFNLTPRGKPIDFGCYSFMPKSNLPIKVICLDNTQREDDNDPSIHGRAFLDEDRWNWLKKELADGTKNDQLMVIACHIPIGVMPYKEHNNGHDTYMDWYENTRGGTIENAVTFKGLLKELHSHPNLLMWMAGHRHVNTVKAFVHDEPEKSFWHVETSSLHDFPIQMRMFDINLNSDYTISIDAINVSPAVKKGTPAYKGFKYAVAAQQITGMTLNPKLDWADPKYDVDGIDPTIRPIDPTIASYNAKLLKKLTPKMEAKMKELFPNI